MPKQTKEEWKLRKTLMPSKRYYMANLFYEKQLFLMKNTSVHSTTTGINMELHDENLPSYTT